MRVPVYPKDLAHNRGFKSLAKRLRRQWGGPHPISLELAQEVLAKGFGYLDFYDLRQESKSWTPDAPSPRFTDIRRGILTAAKAAMSPQDLLATDQAELERLVASLPLTVLMVTTALQVNRMQPESCQGTLIGICISTFERPAELSESLTSCLQCPMYRRPFRARISDMRITSTTRPPTAGLHLLAPNAAWLLGLAVHGDVSSLLNQSINVVPIASAPGRTTKPGSPRRRIQSSPTWLGIRGT